MAGRWIGSPSLVFLVLFRLAFAYTRCICIDGVDCTISIEYDIFSILRVSVLCEELYRACISITSQHGLQRHKYPTSQPCQQLLSITHCNSYLKAHTPPLQSKMSNYLNTLTNTSAFPLEVQSAASALAPSKDALHAAIDGAIAAPESENSLSGDHADLLERGFEYATQVVKMLAGEPAAEEKLDVRRSCFFCTCPLYLYLYHGPAR